MIFNQLVQIMSFVLSLLCVLFRFKNDDNVSDKEIAAARGWVQILSSCAQDQTALSEMY